MENQQELYHRKRFFNSRDAYYVTKLPVGTTSLIAGVFFSFTKNTVKLTAFFLPLYFVEEKKATLIIKGKKSGLTRKQECDIVYNLWHCTFRIDFVSEKESWSYHVRYRPKKNGDEDPTYIYDGFIPKPVDYPRVASVGCFGMDKTKDKTELVDAVLSTSPDLIILSGDMTYNHKSLVFGFLETILTISEITRSTPTIVQMDDHDYGQGNLWGAGEGSQNSGKGFEKTPCLINLLEDHLMGHNPDPSKDTRLFNGLRSRYSNYVYGKMDFAIVESRKFKQSNKTSLLGEEQEEWLEGWCTENKDKTKIILSGSPFASLATHVKSLQDDFRRVNGGSKDSNGFPEEGRKRLMEIINNCSKVVLSGDQHLGAVVTYPDYGVHDCASPAAINSMFWRLNLNEIGKSHADGFGNPYYLHNVWNIDVEARSLIPKLTRSKGNQIKNSRADGFMTVVFDGEKAVCAMHDYWLGHNLRWKVEVPSKV